MGFIEVIIVGAVVFLAAAFVFRKVRTAMKAKGPHGCPSCSCGGAPEEENQKGSYGLPKDSFGKPPEKDQSAR